MGEASRRLNASKLPWKGLDRLLAQLGPLREPDSLYMTEGLREKIRVAVEPMLVAKTHTPGYRFHGMEILAYPAGTIILNRKTGERAVIEDNTILSAIRDDIVIWPNAEKARATPEDDASKVTEG